MSDDGKKSPLERYLEKQKKTREPKPPSSLEARRVASAPKAPAAPSFRTPQATPPAQSSEQLFQWEKKALEQGVPIPPPGAPPSAPDAAKTFGVDPARFSSQASPQASSSNVVVDTPAPEIETMPIAADVGSRFVAYLVDLVILWCIQWPVSKVIFGALGLVSAGFAYDSRQGITFLLSYVAMFFYYGYFYSKKGASPGKMLMGLSIYDEQAGTLLSPWKAFFREAIGKFISAIPFFIGYVVALFRDDRRALHDLLFDTRVVRNIKPSRSGNPR